MRQRVDFLRLLLLSSVVNLVAIRLVTIVNNVTIPLVTIHTLAIDDLVVSIIRSLSVIHVVPVDVLPIILERMTVGMVSVVGLISVGNEMFNLVNLSGRVDIDCNCCSGGSSIRIHPLRVLCRRCIGGGSKSRMIRHHLLGRPSAPDDPANGGARFEESTPYIYGVQ